MLADTMNNSTSTAAAAGTALICGAALPLAALTYIKSTKKPKKQQPILQNNDCTCCHADLKEHSKIFAKEILHVPETNIHVAIGYALANCILIEGDDGLVVIDTTESPDAAREILKDYRQQTNVSKPIQGLIYTHFHHDHVAGTPAFLEDSSIEEKSKIPIYAHHSTEQRISQFNAVMGPIAYERAAKMYGTQLEQPAQENCGIGPLLQQESDSLEKQVVPTHTYEGDGMTITIAGIELQLIHAPGETDDQTVVYYQQHNVLFAADNYYESFPNLYTIRGAPNRDVLQWARSLDVMKNLKASIMVPSHTLPVVGKDKIAQCLQEYRDAIQYVHDQTVQRMLLGQHPDQIGAELQLPTKLQEKEHLKEYYGTVGWSAKAVFDAYLGWYSGDECDLNPLPPIEKSRRLIDLAGSVEAVLEKAQQAMNDNDYQWALELSSAVIRTKDVLKHSKSTIHKAATLKAQACTALGTQQVNANARNWYLTAARLADPNDNQLTDIKLPPTLRRQFIQQAPWGHIFGSFPYRYKAENATENEKIVCFVIHQPDSGENDDSEVWTLSTRNGVMYVNDERNKEDADIVLEGSETSMRSLFTNSTATVATQLLSYAKTQDATVDRLTVTKGSWRQLGAFFANLDRSM